jgi:hypothetical protein
VDSGTTLCHLPSDLAAAVAAQWPGAVLNVITAEYWAPCDNSTPSPPSFGVIVDGRTLWADPEDLLLRRGDRLDWNGDGVPFCRLGIADGGFKGPFILGDTFMNGVLSVFDIGAGEMRFAARTRQV